MVAPGSGSLGGDALPYLLDQIGQSQEIIDPKSTPPGGQRDKGVLRFCVGPASGQAYQLAVLGMEVHPILTPSLSEIDEPKLPPM